MYTLSRSRAASRSRRQGHLRRPCDYRVRMSISTSKQARALVLAVTIRKLGLAVIRNLS